MLVLTDSQKCALSITPKTAAGNPALVDGVPEWSVSNPDILTLEVAEGGLSAVVLANGPVGESQVSVTADADLGEGVAAITGVLDVQVKAGQAVSLSIDAATPEEK